VRNLKFDLWVFFEVWFLKFTLFFGVWGFHASGEISFADLFGGCYNQNPFMASPFPDLYFPHAGKQGEISFADLFGGR
jgi:hypothetical protein